MARLHFRTHPATLAMAAVILLLAGAGSGAIGRGDQALASRVGCGDKITTDTRLDSDLVDCPNNGIVIGADGVTLNLNGHTIDGDRRPFTPCPRRKVCDVGVVSLGHDGVTVMGGSVREFGLGGLVGNARRPRLLGLSSSGNRFSGAEIFSSRRTLVRDSAFIGNGLLTDQAGLGLHNSTDGRFLNNSFRHNGDIGMFVEDCNRNRIEENLFSRNPEAGIAFAGEANRNEIRGNRLSRNGVGIDGGGNRTVIARNRVTASRAPRGGDGPGVGILIAVGHQAVVARNVVTGSREAGILVGLFAGEVGGGPTAVDTVIRANRLGRGNRDAVPVRKTAIGTMLRRNRAHGSRDDGFDVESRTAKLTGNRAVGNADLGIEAVRGVTDGGGNIARGNGNRAQCVNIACG